MNKFSFSIQNITFDPFLTNRVSYIKKIYYSQSKPKDYCALQYTINLRLLSYISYILISSIFSK